MIVWKLLTRKLPMDALPFDGYNDDSPIFIETYLPRYIEEGTLDGSHTPSDVQQEQIIVVPQSSIHPAKVPQLPERHTVYLIITSPISRILFCVLLALLFAIHPALWPEAFALAVVTTFDMLSLTMLQKLPDVINLCLGAGAAFSIGLTIAMCLLEAFFPFAILFAIFFITTLTNDFLLKNPSLTMRVVQHLLKIYDLVVSTGLLIALRTSLDPAILRVYPILAPLIQCCFMLKYIIIVGCTLILVKALLSLVKKLTYFSSNKSRASQVFEQQHNKPYKYRNFEIQQNCYEQQPPPIRITTWQNTPLISKS